MSGRRATLLDRLRAARAARATDTSGTYWSAVADLASGREPACDPDQLLTALQQLGRAEADLEQDADHLRELQDLEAEAEELDQHRADLDDALERATEAGRSARELERQAAELRGAADRRVLGLRMRIEAAETAAGQALAVRRRLAARGHREAVAAVEAHDTSRRRVSDLGQARVQLSIVERDLRDARQQLDIGPQHARDHVRAVVDKLEARRDQLQAQIAELEHQDQEVTHATA